MKIKVLYVMGAGRSGSTILGVTLGNCDDFFHAGELDAWLRRYAIPNFSGAARTKFWAAIRDALGDVDGLYGDRAWRYLEHSAAIFRPRRRRAVRDLRARYRDVCQALYREIANHADRSVIVDTSHYPLRAREMAHLPDVELYLLYLVRSPVDVVASFRKKGVRQTPKPMFATIPYLLLTSLLSTYVYFFCFPRDHRVFLRYEDLCATPEAVIRRILALSGSTSPIPDLDALDTGVAFQGNRILRSRSVRLERREESDPRSG